MYLFSQNCLGIHLIDLPDSVKSDEFIKRRDMNSKPPISTTTAQTTKHWLFRQSAGIRGNYEDEKDLNLKNKITQLVQQTLHDTERKVNSIHHFKEENREVPPYRIGFILSLVKKARDVLNELFNVAVKHRDSWKALEQLKIFELIVHTNVDTTNLVRQLVEIHIQNLNGTSPSTERRRVVLI